MMYQKLRGCNQIQPCLLWFFQVGSGFVLTSCRQATAITAAYSGNHEFLFVMIFL